MRWAGLDQYEEMLHDDVFWQALWNTLIFIASAPVGIVIALGLALLVSSDIRGRDVYRTIIFISYPLMTVAVAIIWRWLFDERVGLINYVARSLASRRPPDPVPQFLRLGAALGHRREYLADARAST